MSCFPSEWLLISCMLYMVRSCVAVSCSVEYEMRMLPLFKTLERFAHRVGGVISFFSSRRNWDSPTPHPQARVPPPPRFWGEGHTRWQERGWESPMIPTRGHTLCMVLFILYIKSRLFWALKWHEWSECHLGPKKSSNAPSNHVAPLKTIKYKRHKNNWYIGSFMYPSAVV